MERWESVRNAVAEPQPFFQTHRNIVDPYLSKLATQLWKVAAADRDRFQLTVLEALQGLTEDIARVRLALEQGRVQNQRKVWRELSSQWIPLPSPDLSVSSNLLVDVFAPALYDTFGINCYIKFTTLFWSSLNEGFGFYMHTGYATFVANVRQQLIDNLHAAKGEAPPPSRPLLEQMKLYWQIESSLPHPSRAFEAVEFIYDGPQHRISFSPVPLTGGKLIVNANMTTSDALRAYVVILKSNNLFLQVDFKSFHPASVKLLTAISITKTASLAPFRVNANDPEEWDYDEPGVEEAVIDA